MKKIFLGCFLLMMIVIGCNLSSDIASESGGDDDTSTTIESTDVLDDCTPRMDWPIYAVQPGDNLTYIAQATGTTVDELIAANCLANPNALKRGQELYVPVLPESS